MEINERITALENDFTVTKGEIKKLLLDIREMMNNIENPFYNVEELTAKMQEERKDVEMPEQEEKPEVEAEVEAEDLAKISAEEEKESIPEPEDKQKLELTKETKEREAGKKEDKKAIKSVIEDIKGFDLFTIAELMKWSDYALGTIGHAKMSDLLDIFGLTRHISDDMKRLILKISALTSSDAEGKEKEKEIKKVDMRDCIIALYQLNRIINPEDRSTDSVMLSMYLRGEDTAWKV